MLSSASTMCIQKSAATQAAKKPYATKASDESGSKARVDSQDVLAGSTAGPPAKALAPNPDDQSQEEKRLLKEGALTGKLLGSGKQTRD